MKVTYKHISGMTLSMEFDEKSLAWQYFTPTEKLEVAIQGVNHQAKVIFPFELVED